MQLKGIIVNPEFKVASFEITHFFWLQIARVYIDKNVYLSIHIYLHAHTHTHTHTHSYGDILPLSIKYFLRKKVLLKAITQSSNTGNLALIQFCWVHSPCLNFVNYYSINVLCNCSFLVQDPTYNGTLHLIVISLKSLSVWNSSWVFLCFSWPWHF